MDQASGIRGDSDHSTTERRDERSAEAPWEPLDWRRYLVNGIPEPEYIQRPHVPKQVRIWCPGPQESGKSVWALWTCARAAHSGYQVAYFSGENPIEEDIRRLGLVVPEDVSSEQLAFYHRVGIDLARREDQRHLLEIAQTRDLIVIDTITSCWSGDEDDNSAIAELDRAVLAPATATGTSLVVLDHTGHGRPRPRGASAKGQKADVVLNFGKAGPRRVAIKCERFRPGGRHPDPVTYDIVDTDGRMDLIESGSPSSESPGTARPDLMETVSRYLEGVDGKPSKRQVISGVRGRDGDVAVALSALVARGHVDKGPGERSGNTYQVVRPFRRGSGS